MVGSAGAGTHTTGVVRRGARVGLYVPRKDQEGEEPVVRGVTVEVTDQAPPYVGGGLEGVG